MFIDVLNLLMKAKKINKSILARESGVPYTTIDAFYKKGCDNVKLSTLQKLASYFGVSLDYLINGEMSSNSTWVETFLTSHEKLLIASYRTHPEMQQAVDRLLGVEAAGTVGEDIASEVSEAMKKSHVLK